MHIDLLMRLFLIHVKSKIISEHQIMKLSDLRLMYVNELDITEFSEPDYREDKLKSRLESDANI